MSAAGALATVVDMTTSELAGMAELKTVHTCDVGGGNLRQIARRGLSEVCERIVQRVGIGKHYA